MDLNNQKKEMFFSFETLKEQLYKNANDNFIKSVKIKYFAIFLNFTIAISSLLMNKEYLSSKCISGISLSVIITFLLGIIPLLFIIKEANYSSKYQKYREWAEKIRKLKVLRRIANYEFSKIDEAYFFSKIPQQFINSSLKEIQDIDDYYSNQTEYSLQIIDNIQQDCFYTNTLINRYLPLIRKERNIYLLITILLVFIIIILNLHFHANIESFIISAIIIFVKGYMGFKYNSYYKSFDEIQKRLKDIHQNLEILKNNPGIVQLVVLFNEYNEVIKNMLPYNKENFYIDNEESIKFLWLDLIKKNKTKIV